MDVALHLVHIDSTNWKAEEYWYGQTTYLIISKTFSEFTVLDKTFETNETIWNHMKPMKPYETYETIWNLWNHMKPMKPMNIDMGRPRF